MSKWDYNEIKKKFFIGLTCFVVGVVFAIGAHHHAQELDLGRLLFYDTSDLRVYAFVGSFLAGFFLCGVPFVRLRLITALYMLAFYLISQNGKILDWVEKSGADYIVFQKKDGSYDYNNEKSRFRVVVECILGIILLIVGGLVVYAIGIALSIFVLIFQLIFLIVKRKNQYSQSNEAKDN